MFRGFRFLSMLLVGMLLVGGLVAFAPGGEREAKAALGPLQAVTLTGADFHPNQDGFEFFNDGGFVYGRGPLLARIPFPAEVVVITTVKVRYYDNSAADSCVTLYRAVPGDTSQDLYGQDCTSGQSETNPQTLSWSVFRRVGRYHTAYLRATFGTESSADIWLYGATVFYRVVT